MEAELLRAAERGDVTVVKRIVQSGSCDINCRDWLDRTPLHYACQRGHLDVTKTLLKHSVDPESPDVDGWTPLHWACLNGHTDIVKHLCQVRANVNCATEDGETPLHIARREGHLDSMKILCEYKANPDCADKWGQTPLHEACRSGRTDIVKHLCQVHANVDCADKNGKTPLHKACWEGHLDSMKILCEYKANPDCADKWGQTPLHEACRYRHFAVEKHRCQVRAKVNCAAKDGETPLHIARREGEMMKILCEYKANPDCADEWGQTPLHWACREGHLESMKILYEYKANPDCADGRGRTPLHLACMQNRKDVVHYLLSEMHCNVNAVTEDGKSALGLTKNVDIIRQLISYGASVKDVYVHYGSMLAPTYQKQPTKSIVKTFVVGDPEAGKSTLVKALENESGGLSRIFSYFVKVSGIDQKTAGIIPHNFESQQFGRITIYDFAGHKEFYGSHAAMLQNTITGSSAALFLLLADLRKDEEEFKQSILFWSSFIDNQLLSVDAKPHVIVVGSHADQVKSKAEISLKNNVVYSLVKTSAFASLLFTGFFPINCCYSESSALSELRQCIAKSCESLKNGAELSFNCHCFLLYLHDRFRDTPALQIKEAADRIQIHSAELPTASADRTVLGFIPNDFHTLHKLCIDLNERGNILFLRSPNKPEESWIVLDQDLLLSRVTGTVFAPEGFKEHHSIANSTGVVPLSQLKSFFSDLDVDMLAHFLSHLEFCQEVSDKEVLQLLGTSESSQEVQERFLFFPALVSIAAPDSVWQARSKFSYYSGWILQSSQAEQFFMPRFLQVLILRLAFSFALTTDVEMPSSDLPTLQRKCTVWKNGISWAGTSGVEALVEVVAQRRVNVILRCLKGREVACTRIRSTIIQKIRSAKEEFCPKVLISELFINPTDTIQYPLKPISELNLVGYFQLAKAIVATEPCVVDTVGAPVDLEELLYFEPYSDLGEEILCKLFDEQCPQSKELVSDDFLYRLADRAYRSKDKFAQLFNSPHTTMLHERISRAPPGPTHELVRVFQLWRDCSEGSYQCLRKELDNFSVFAGRNPLESHCKT